MEIEKTEGESVGALGVLVLVLGFLALLFVVSLWLRSGPGGGVPVGEVTGRLTIDGKPCVNAHVLFSDRTRGIYIFAVTDGDGRYEAGIAKQRGLPLGEYKVTVTPPPSPDPRPDIPQPYRNSRTSGLEIKVVPEGKVFDIKMKSK